MSTHIINLTDIIDTNLITCLKIEFVILCTTTYLETHISTLEATCNSTFLIESTNFVSCALRIGLLCLTAEGIGEIRTYVRQQSNIV